MNFDWSSYLEIAQILYDEVINTSNQENSASIKEAKIRSAISRAYYSAFCLTRNYLRDFEGYTDLATRTKGVHEYVISELQNSTQQDFINLGNYLDRLRSLRVEADYKDNAGVNLLIAKAKIALKDAKKVVDLIEKLTSQS
ncbi:MAG TPA: HEPN domain-containing protein [Nostocaceae cyanobacterium]|nr:HEPN domain-containing protein [Nostocaceae cyanobacterium]